MDWALGQARSTIDFDSAVWAIGIRGLPLHSIHLYGQPDEFIESWERDRTRSFDLNLVVEGGACRGVALTDLARPDGRTSAHYSLNLRRFCDRYGIQHALCASHREVASCIENFICFYRAPYRASFSESDRQTQEFLAPHLVEARNNNLFCHFSACNERVYLSAICDRFGLLHHTECGFVDLLHLEWPDLRYPYLPCEFNKRLVANPALTFEGSSIVIKSSPIGDLVHIQARRQSRVVRLSAQERLVTKHLVSGQTYKQIARSLRLSPSTVTKHANSIYRKTGAANKTELAGIFAGNFPTEPTGKPGSIAPPPAPISPHPRT
jgi:DNA-binding CsgD family transcriptional regulator